MASSHDFGREDVSAVCRALKPSSDDAPA